MARPTRFLILPAQGLQASAGVASAAATTTLTDLAHKTGVASMRTRLQGVVKASAKAGAKLKAAAFNLVASLNEDGVKLVEATPEMMAALRFEQPGLRAVPEVFYRPAVEIARIRRRATKPAGATAAAVKKLVVTVVNADTGDPVAGVGIVAFTDFDARAGVGGTTSSTGKVTLSVPGGTTYERVYAQHEHPGLWSFLGKNVPTNGALTIELEPLDLSAADSLRSFHTVGADLTVGAGVKVGVIDSGVDGNHADLVVAGGLGCVPGSPENQFGPSGSHGTHVAGIIAGRGSPPTGMRGIAPGASIFSYRVFDDTPNSGSSFGLVKAIRQGIEDGCDLLNMSLSFDQDDDNPPAVDDAVHDAIEEAHAAGVVVLAAAGNDGRKPVSYPAMDDLAIAVSAVGRKGTFPAKSSESGDVAAPFGTDPKNFLAAFSNVGTALDVAGAGVGVVSTVPGGGHAPMSGTSMACPAVTGVLARLLANNPTVLNMARDANRADAIKALLFAQAQSLGLGVANEGKGLPA